MMKQYIFKLLWVAVPALIFCVFSSWVLYKGGELKTLDRVCLLYTSDAADEL